MNNLGITLHRCNECDRWIPPGEAVIDDEQVVLCEPCSRLRAQVEARISELCSRPGGMSREDIARDLEAFGVDIDLVVAAEARLLARGKLVEPS